ncbi:hypothetical protein FD724_34860 (plasmid) [Nostoc sp. C057]|uniref:hypothetical protein n=1 Tax=Nostoc sp. C057 TaxID=2576903 RepID=UPI0015C35240|nr:hypothetical protein [Nostoc sp. C057]QLE53131.1 hypothetical protein FD724_34860 [Nostoc sp. C057]
MNTSLSLWRSRLTRISHALLKACASAGSLVGAEESSMCLVLYTLPLCPFPQAWRNAGLS